MIKENQFVEVVMAPSTKNWYESLGYKYKFKEHFYITPKDLPTGSHKKIDVICDFCQKEYNLEYRYYLKNTQENNGKFKCMKCYFQDTEWNEKRISKGRKTNLKKYGFEVASKSGVVKEKMKQTCMKKYGVEYVSQTDFVKEKIRNSFQENYSVNSALQVDEFKEKFADSCMKKYGVKNPMQSTEVREKASATNLERYGFESSLLNNKVKEKAKQTTLKHFGVEHSLSSEKVRKKAKETNLIKYGYENPAKSPEIQKKIRETFFKNGSIRTSKQQLEIYKIIKDKYDSCELNFPVGIYNLDCALFINDIKIDIEYDGWYWHSINNMPEKDKERNSYIKNQGFKILRIKGGREIPTSDILLSLIEELKNSTIEYKELVLQEWKENIIEKDY